MLPKLIEVTYKSVKIYGFKTSAIYMIASELQSINPELKVIKTITKL